MPDARILKIEKMLAVAHRALWAAANESETLRDTGLTDDLYGVCTEVGRLNSEMLKSTRGRKSVAS